MSVGGHPMGFDGLLERMGSPCYTVGGLWATHDHGHPRLITCSNALPKAFIPIGQNGLRCLGIIVYGFEGLFWAYLHFSVQNFPLLRDSFLLLPHYHIRSRQFQI